MRGRGPPDITQMNGSYQSNKYQDTRIGKRENEKTTTGRKEQR
jgi:hypothetical protein